MANPDVRKLKRMDAVLRAAGLTKQVSSPEGTLTILDDVSLSIGRGESVALVGPSGAGKTTLLAILAGLDRPTKGRVWLCGEELTAMDEDGRALLRARRVGFVFQSFQLLGNYTARENILLPLELVGHPDPGQRADELLAKVGLAARGHHYPVQLSGGEQQRVALARAFATRPAILFADEPTGNLDSATGQGVLAILADLQRHDGTTLVLVTHDSTVAALADRRIHLRDGRVERDERGARGHSGTNGPA